MNIMYKRITSISWKKEATKITLQNDEMVELIKNTKATRKLATTKTKRAEFDELHYGLEKHGDYYELYMFKDGKYYIFSNNSMDISKNEKSEIGRADRLFEKKFIELNGTTLRRAFGFVDKTLKRCIPKQFYFVNERYLNKIVKASSIDASSQYPSGCLGLLPDMHKAIRVKGRVKPNKEFPFAFYASGHIAIYNELDTHNWISHPLRNYLFRLNGEKYGLRQLKDEEDETILMQASDYTMDSTWDYFYNNKKQCTKDTEEYKIAKLIMNKTIGCWHSKDKDEKRIMSYEDHGSYQLAHIVAVAIARGNQKILNKLEEIDNIIPLFSILHICVDGIIYLGDKIYGQDKDEFGKFSQEFVNADFLMKGQNLYCARKDNHCIKFKHSGFDLLDGKFIDEDQDFEFSDLDKLSCNVRVGDIVNG